MTLSECVKAVQEGRATKFKRGGCEYVVKEGRVYLLDSGNMTESYDISKVSFLLDFSFELIDECPKGYTRKEDKFVRTLLYKRWLTCEKGTFRTYEVKPLEEKVVKVIEIPVEVEYPN